MIDVILTIQFAMTVETTAALSRILPLYVFLGMFSPNGKL